jgi:hypothetical protein
MNATLRTITVSAATVAVLGLAGTATAADLTTPAHHQAVVAVADAGTVARPAAYVQPVNPATFNQAPATVPASATGTAVGVGGTAILLLGLGVWYAIRKGGHKLGWMLCSFALGVLLAGGALGTMTQTAVSSAVTAVASFGGNLS